MQLPRTFIPKLVALSLAGVASLAMTQTPAPAAAPATEPSIPNSSIDQLSRDRIDKERMDRMERERMTAPASGNTSTGAADKPERKAAQRDSNGNLVARVDRN